MYKYLGDNSTMSKVSLGFLARSNGISKGAIGALDEWLVRIVRPEWIRDMIKNPTTLFSRMVLCTQ